MHTSIVPHVPAGAYPRPDLRAAVFPLLNRACAARIYLVAVATSAAIGAIA